MKLDSQDGRGQCNVMSFGRSAWCIMLPDLDTVDGGDGFNVKCERKKAIVIFENEYKYTNIQ